MKIDLQNTCGKKTITRDDGKKIGKMILNAWEKKERVIIDFNNILIASVSFVDEAFGKLAFKYSKKFLQEKLSFENMDKYDRALLNDILISRYHQKELGQNGASRERNK